MGSVNEVFRTSTKAETKRYSHSMPRVDGIRPRQVCDLPATRARRSPSPSSATRKDMEMVLRRLQRQPRQLPGAAGQPPEVRVLHGAQHDTEVIMYELMRPFGGRASPTWARSSPVSRASSTAPTTSCSSTRRATSWCCGTPMGFRPLSLHGLGPFRSSQPREQRPRQLRVRRLQAPGTRLHDNGQQARGQDREASARSLRGRPTACSSGCTSQTWLRHRGKPVYTTRRRLGIELAEDGAHRLNGDDYVVLFTCRRLPPRRLRYAEQVGMPCRRASSEQARREDVHRRKGNRRTRSSSSSRYCARNQGQEAHSGGRQIVRGNTKQRLVRFCGAARCKGGHLRISCPPIVSPCFYGIDMSTFDELIAARNVKDPVSGRQRRKQRLIASEGGADSTSYQTTKNSLKSIGLPKGDLCMASSRRLPEPVRQALCRVAIENAQEQDHASRAYDRPFRRTLWYPSGIAGKFKCYKYTFPFNFTMKSGGGLGARGFLHV